MPKRIVNHTVIVQREGVSVQPKIGQPYDFTAEEVSQIKRLNPEALSTLPESKAQDEDNGDTVTMSKADFERQLNDARETDRANLEKELREQILAEQNGDAQRKTASEPEPDVKNVKGTGGKTSGSKAGQQSNTSTSTDDDI